MIELIAITDDPAAPAPPLRAVRSGGLAVLWAPADDAEATTPEALWRREELLEALMEERDLLPVRFGTRVADERAAAQALSERWGELRAGLDRVRGAVELAVRVRGGEADAPPRPATGRDYIAAKAGRSRAALALHEPLAELARASVIQHADELLRAAYLVDRDAVEAFTERVRTLQLEHPELALLCTGPWPPYSFAERAA